MKDITVTYTLEVTEIMRGVDDSEEEIINDTSYGEALKVTAKKCLDADDVVLRDFKAFVQDAPEQECESCKIQWV